MVDEAEWQSRKDAWQPPQIHNQTPWQEFYRTRVDPLGEGGCVDLASARSAATCRATTTEKAGAGCTPALASLPVPESDLGKVKTVPAPAHAGR